MRPWAAAKRHGEWHGCPKAMGKKGSAAYYKQILVNTFRWHCMQLGDHLWQSLSINHLVLVIGEKKIVMTKVYCCCINLFLCLLYWFPLIGITIDNLICIKLRYSHQYNIKVVVVQKQRQWCAHSTTIISINSTRTFQTQSGPHFATWTNLKSLKSFPSSEDPSFL